MKTVRLPTQDAVRAQIASLNLLGEPVGIDTETTGLDWRTDSLTDIVVASEDAGYVFSPEYAAELSALTPLLVMQNFKFDLHMLLQAGVDLRNRPIRDTRLLDHLRMETDDHSLDAMVQRNFKDNYKAEFWAKYKTIDLAPESERIEYAAKDGVYTVRLYKILARDLARQGVPDPLIEHVHRLALALFETEHAGIKIDKSYLLDRGVYLQEQITRLLPLMRGAADIEITAMEYDKWEEEIAKRKSPLGKQRVPKPEFSFDSSAQLKTLLYDALGLTLQFNEKTKAISTDEDALEALREEHPLIPLLLEYRGHKKVYTAYIEGTLERAVGDRIYPEFNVNGTKTGRISHSNPNMGQLPSKGGIRGIYVPDDGYVLVSADYAQLEVVVAAHFSMDPNLLKIINEGTSKHDITASALGVDRSVAKTLNFAMQYQCSHFKVQKIIESSEAEAKAVWEKYWSTYAGEKRVIDDCCKRVDLGLPIVSPFGRRRHFPRHVSNKWERSKHYRQAYSSLVQGTGGDLTSWAFYTVDRELRRRGIGKGLFTVHDEVLIQARSGDAEEAQQLLIDTMVRAAEVIKLKVPLKAEGSGPMQRWED